MNNNNFIENILKTTDRSFVIYMYMAEGSSNGVKVIEKSNWSGVGIYIPRHRFVNNKNRQELKKPGVYLLLGDTDLIPKIYIGEGDPLLDRLISHEAKKDFWNILIAFTSKDQSLNKAIIQYLEARLCNISERSGRFQIENRNTPQAPSLSEMDLAVAEGYLEEMLLCLPVLGVPLEIPRLKSASNENKYYLKTGKGIYASAVQNDSGFTVLEGSLASIEETKSIPSALKTMREELLSKQIIFKSKNDHYIFSRNFAFGSPSTAAGVVQGRSSNGRIDWKDERGISLKEKENV